MNETLKAGDDRAAREQQIREWLADFVADPASPDRTADILRLGWDLPWVSGAVERAKEARWLADEVGADAIDRPKGSAAQVHFVPALGSGKAAQTERSAPSSAPVGTPSVPPPSAVASPLSFADALRNRRRAMGEKQAAAAELQALIDGAGAAKKICEGPQPDVAADEIGEPEDAESEAEVDYSAQPDEEEEVGEPDEPEWFVPELPRVVLSRSNPNRTAEVFAERQVWENRESGERVRGMHYWCGEFWEWKERSFKRLSKDAVHDRVCRFLVSSRTQTANGDVVAFNPKVKDITETIGMLRSVLMLGDELVPPLMWNGGRWESTKGSLMFRNGLLNLATGRLEPHSPRLWVQGGVGYDWDPRAVCPTWRRFLGEVFPGDVESQMCLEEAMGYSMTEDVQFQKGFLLVGESGRNGKGTVLGVLEGLVGSAGYVALDVHTWLATAYSSECLIGRRVGAFPDMRLEPPQDFGRVSRNPGGLDHASKEQMLKVTAADGMTLGRKYVKEPWEGRLFMKEWIACNEFPNFNDNVLPTRFVNFYFGVSFLGREDPKLAERLAAELPGIAVRCLRAYRRLVARGRFVQPGSGEGLAAEVRSASDPFRRWFEERWVWDPAAGEVLFSVVDESFRAWCEKNGERELERRLSTRSQLSKRIKEVYGREVVHPNNAPRRYLGLRRRAADEGFGWGEAGNA